MHPMMGEYLFFLFGFFVIGTVVGSWLNVCIHRLSQEDRLWPALRSLAYPPSHCPRCKSPIAWYDNVPILGWVFLRGRCRNCRGRIAVRYPLIELLTGVLFALLYWCEIPLEWNISGGTLAHPYGPVALQRSLLAVVHIRFALHLVLLCALLVATFIDIDLRIIPDAVTLPAMLIAIVVQTATGFVFLVPVWYQTPRMAGAFSAFALPFAGPPLGEGWIAQFARFIGVPEWIGRHPHLHGLAVSLAGLALGGCVIWGIRIVGGWVLKREAMGFGDVILMAMIGSFIGWQGIIAVFVLAPLLAVVGTLVPMLIWKTRSIPYGPYLSAATLLVLLGFRWLIPYLEEGVLALGPFLPVAALSMLLALAALLGLWSVIKRRLGWDEPVLDEEWVEEWLPGDQLAYLAGERNDDRQGQWRTAEWPGRLAGRGQAQTEFWRNPGSNPLNKR